MEGHFGAFYGPNMEKERIWIRIRIKVKSRIRIEVMRTLNRGKIFIKQIKGKATKLVKLHCLAFLLLTVL